MPGRDLVWNLQLTAGPNGVLVDRGVARLLDASGMVVGQTTEFHSRSMGCSGCTGDVRIGAGMSATYNGHRITYVGGGAPVRFTYTLTFVDDQNGASSISLEVPVL
jgi:hypothetical protein